MKSALGKLTGDLAGSYYPLTAMDKEVRQQLVDDHFFFISGDRNLTVSFAEGTLMPEKTSLHSEVALIQTMINGVNTLWKEDKALQKKHYCLPKTIILI